MHGHGDKKKRWTGHSSQEDDLADNSDLGFYEVV